MGIIKRIFTDPDFDQLNNMVRWNGLSVIKSETVAQHTYVVTFITRILLEEIFIRIKSSFEYHEIVSNTMSYAIFHDFDESFTGDITNNFKHNEHNGESIRGSIHEYISHVRLRKFNNFAHMVSNNLFNEYVFTTNIPRYQRRIVKLADWLSMLFYLTKEIRMGNTNVKSQWLYCISETVELASLLMKELSTNNNADISVLEEITQTNFYENGN